MASVIVQIINPAGLHARPSASLVKLSSSFKSKVFLDQDGYKVNAKSILGVMTLAAEQGSELTLSAIGEDEEVALQKIKTLFDAGFYEMEGDN
jgi:phosphocarrier protein